MAALAEDRVVPPRGCKTRLGRLGRGVVYLRARPMKKPQRRELFQYDGHTCIGRIVIDPDGQAKAFNSTRKRLGTFPDFRAAMAAISAAHMSAVGPTVRRAAKRASKLPARPVAHA
jgi:hypothetical protein